MPSQISLLNPFLLLIFLVGVVVPVVGLVMFIIRAIVGFKQSVYGDYTLLRVCCVLSISLNSLESSLGYDHGRWSFLSKSET
jgi:hypothetical protein